MCPESSSSEKLESLNPIVIEKGVHPPIIFENNIWWRPFKIKTANSIGNIDRIKYLPREIKDSDNFLIYERVVPDTDVGPQKFQQELFIEFERTFGRGKANAITHGYSAPVKTRTESDRRSVILNEYNRIVSGGIKPSEKTFTYQFLARAGEEEDVNKKIEDLRRFRIDHPELYEDYLKILEPAPNFAG